MTPLSLKWLPESPDFAAQLRAARSTTSDADRLQALSVLAGHRLDYVQTIQLSRSLDGLPSETRSALAPVKLALLGSSTIEHLVPAIRVGGLRHRLLITPYVNTYGQYRQELLEPAPRLTEFSPQVVLFSLSAHEAIATVPLAASSQDAAAVIDARVNELRGLWLRARELFGATVIQQTFLNAAEPLFGAFERQVSGAPAQLIARLNERVAEATAAEGVALLDVARASERDGLDSWFDVNRWLQAKMEIAPAAAVMYGELLARIVAAQRGLSRKCLVLDLDNTLWGGVVGDDGVAGIVLGEGSGAGEAHLALQHYARRLHERGVILAVCSKNDPAVARAAVETHPEMVLRLAHFSAFFANWDDKAANLPRLATQLNIGIESLVFVDDNPVERARIRESLPMVAVPDLPDDPSGYVRNLADAGYFETVAFTADDRLRNEQYAGNAARDSLLATSQTMDDFLRGLDMRVEYDAFRPADLARVTQLINKTNQFNPTTRRYSHEQVATFCDPRRFLTLQCRLLDRFGDNGLVAVIVLRRDAERTDICEIDTWVMSCRVFGRQLEHEAMNIAVETAREHGVTTVVAEYLPTEKNRVVKDLYPTLGFTETTERDALGGSRWSLSLAQYVPHPTHITRITH